MKKRAGSGGLVYSSELGATCPVCEQALAQCHCHSEQAVPSGDGVVRIGRESKGRRGKTVTIVKGLALPPAELSALAKRLKKMCGSGGTLKGGVLEIQGDHRDRLAKELEREGWTVKQSGG